MFGRGISAHLLGWQGIPRSLDEEKLKVFNILASFIKNFSVVSAPSLKIPEPMSRAATQKKQHLKVSDDQLELETISKKTRASAMSGDIDSQVAKAQKQIDELRYKQEELNRQAQELQEISEKKQEFLVGQIEVIEKYTSALTHMDREIFEMKQEVEDLEQTRKSFASHLKKIENLDPNKWKRNEISTKLDQGLSYIDQAEDEFEMASDYFSGSRALVFGSQRSSYSGGGFGEWFKTNILSNTPFLFACLFGAALYLLNR